MFFGKKKKDGSAEIILDEDQFCKVLKEHADDVKPSYYISTNSDQYTLLYRDGRFLGMPTPFGGPLYPFAKDPTREGSKGQLKDYKDAKIVGLSKDFEVKVHWGTREPFIMRDTATGNAYNVGARGVFYIRIDATDAARNADRFYSKCLAQRNAETFKREVFMEFFAEMFIINVGAKIQEYLEGLNLPLSDGIGLQPAEFVKVSNDLYPQVKDTFAQYGLTIVDSSKNSMLTGLNITPKA